MLIMTLWSSPVTIYCSLSSKLVCITLTTLTTQNHCLITLSSWLCFSVSAPHLSHNLCPVQKVNHSVDSKKGQLMHRRTVRSLCSSDNDSDTNNSTSILIPRRFLPCPQISDPCEDWVLDRPRPPAGEHKLSGRVYCTSSPVLTLNLVS